MNSDYSPPPAINTWIRLFLGLTLGVAIGLSPYLGLLKVPFFRSLLELIPLNLQNNLIPLSSAAMGVIAATIQWYGGERISRETLNRLFIRCLLVCALAFFALIIVHTLFVVTISIKGENESVSFIVGYSRQNQEPCPASVSDSACIEILSFDQSEISSYWGDRQIRIARLLLFGTYLFFTCTFAGIIGLIVLREKITTQHKISSKEKALKKKK